MDDINSIANSGMLYCPKCRRSKREANFYQYKDGTKCELCKECLTMHIKNDDPETFKWILEKFDVPWLPWEWNILYERAYAKDPYKMNGLSVIGKYLSKMKLKQFKSFHWADTEALQMQHDEQAKLNGNVNQITEEKMAEMEEAYKNGEITEAQWMTYKQTQDRQEPQFQLIDGAIVSVRDNIGEAVTQSPYEKVEIPDVALDLTQEDKVYLAMKWGQLYTPQEWVALEKEYKDYEDSFDLHNADLIAGTKQLCKLDLKSHQALDSGDIDNYSKIARAYDALRKSLKFTEAQRKEEKGAEFSSYGQIVAFAEKMNDEDFIRPIDMSVDRDIVDKDINNIKKYTKTLIEDDPAVFKMIEQYIKKREALMSQELDAQRFAEGGELTDEEIKDYNDNIEMQRQIDNDEYEEDEDYEEDDE